MCLILQTKLTTIMIKLNSKIATTLKFLLLICIFSTGGIIISKKTYDLIESRKRAVFSLAADDFYGEPSLNGLFNFKTNLNKAVNRFKDSFSIDNNALCPIAVIGDTKPIRVSYNSGVDSYSIILIDNDEAKIQKCFNSILDELKLNYYNHVRNLIKQIERDRLITQRMLNSENDRYKKSINKLESDRLQRGRFEKLVISNEKKITFSKVVSLLDEKKIKTIAIGEDMALITTNYGEKFYTVSKSLIVSSVIMEKMIESQTDFFLINEDSGRNSAVTRFRTSQKLEVDVKKALYRDLLNREPYIFLKEDIKIFKIEYKKYMLIILALANIIALIFFYLISKNIQKTTIRWYKKII